MHTTMPEAISHNSTLKTIWLGGNNIEDAGAAALVEGAEGITAENSTALNAVAGEGYEAAVGELAGRVARSTGPRTACGGIGLGAQAQALSQPWVP